MKGFIEEIQDHDTYVNDLARMIYDFCGLNYLNNPSALASKVAKRLSVLNMSFREYSEFLKRNRQEWDQLVELVTNNETYFFREESQLHELRNVILPQLRNQTCIRIWSAACSTGEEPYSLAMTVAEAGIVPLGSVRIIATDINRKVLQIARRGWYHKHSLCFRRTPQEMLDKYFFPQDEGYQIKSYIKDRVEFRQANLLQDADLEAIEQVDVIFCRNVLIYFDSLTTRRVIEKLYDRLRPGGFLFLGHAETITGMNTRFETINAGATFYYRKGAAASSPLG
ncbi:CheR family methyltransferase [Brevibacillus marinus]|uniref:CheR family methyltransferase n=1 Tax=Brevibacillus marinus TaxID=2496837 RepID=UPI001F4966A8|nr:protein-glutamate O-methyltransferase CheR [Brevibacillus marinus]